MKREHREELLSEFERQVATLVRKGYPKAAGLTNQDFISSVNALHGKVAKLTVSSNDPRAGRLAFVLVVKSDGFSVEKGMSLVRREGERGFTKMFPRVPADFVSSVSIPSGMAYLLVDVDRGNEYNNVTPRDALARIKRKRRSPLTIDEGVAILLHYPEFLAKNKCFSLLASRCRGDQRVPAIWITHEKRPRLGWCWDGNPHTWLGSASCRRRVGM